MLQARRFFRYSALAALTAVGLLNAGGSSAFAATHAAVPNSCSGPVFSNAKFENVGSHLYLAESTTNDSLVLYRGTNQTWDGYRDPHGHLIIYRCGTNNVLTDDLGAHCKSGFRDCVTVTPYHDYKEQQWTRYESGGIWFFHTLDPSGGNRAIDDPGNSHTSGTRAVMFPYSGTDTAEEFVH